MIGPGKYDDLCTQVRKAAQADGAIVIVINGNKGPGFSAQGDLETLMNLPETLVNIAHQMLHDVDGAEPFARAMVSAGTLHGLLLREDVREQVAHAIRIGTLDRQWLIDLCERINAAVRAEAS